jgi:hypothetical protein
MCAVDKIGELPTSTPDAPKTGLLKCICSHRHILSYNDLLLYEILMSLIFDSFSKRNINSP